MSEIPHEQNIVHAIHHDIANLIIFSAFIDSLLA